MTIKTLEIPTPYGILPVPQNESDQEDRFYCENCNSMKCVWWFTPAPGVDYSVPHTEWDPWMFTIAAVAADLWRRQAQRYCADGYDSTTSCESMVGLHPGCLSCDPPTRPTGHRAKRMLCLESAARCRAWAEKESPWAEKESPPPEKNLRIVTPDWDEHKIPEEVFEKIISGTTELTELDDNESRFVRAALSDWLNLFKQPAPAAAPCCPNQRE